MPSTQAENKALAERYAVNIMSVYQHYRWRAYVRQSKAEHKSPWEHLTKSPDWQKKQPEHDRGASGSATTVVEQDLIASMSAPWQSLDAAGVLRGESATPPIGDSTPVARSCVKRCGVAIDAKY